MDLSSSSSFESSKGDGRKLRANAATARTKPENYVRELGQCLLRDKEQEKEEKALCGILESLSTAAMRVQELGSILAIVSALLEALLIGL